MRDLLTTDISIVAAPLVVMGLTRLWAGARGANYLWPFFNVVISNVPGPRQPFYCVGAPATHYFPISIPYHGCALNVTVQSYLDQLDFGLIACSETVPDAQRIADFVVEDFAALKSAVAEFAKPDIVGKIALALEAKSAAAHQPIALGEAKPPRAIRPPKAEKTNALARNIDALAAATESLRSRLSEKAETAAEPRPEKPAAAKAKAGAKRPPRRTAAPAPTKRAPTAPSRQVRRSQGRRSEVRRSQVGRSQAASRAPPAEEVAGWRTIAASLQPFFPPTEGRGLAMLRFVTPACRGR